MSFVPEHHLVIPEKSGSALFGARHTFKHRSSRDESTADTHNTVPLAPALAAAAGGDNRLNLAWLAPASL